MRTILQWPNMSAVEAGGLIDGKHAEAKFATTRWSVVLSCAHAQSGDAKVQEALSLLCSTYWRPVFAFICRRGYQPNDAQDLTQDFFLMILEGKLLEMADPARGRFRSLLLASLRNFLSDAAVSRLAQKRGGKMQFVSWDDWMAEAPSPPIDRLRATRSLVAGAYL